ncbi:MAG: hypothetical protein IJE55_00620 [Clostridia bacterium]|nr:hypothetical protein [Clostridia bacterium]MBQ7094580.1 hypothetical protein [Clostridia bacterium]
MKKPPIGGFLGLVVGADAHISPQGVDGNAPYRACAVGVERFFTFVQNDSRM